ncbi:MAG TPA: hypothetical protein VFN25_10900 [Dokdonella sp.]|uniref:hypothetical protein n=1 Tax=Dokdonella sp. TaxID=2291710 RepID=UPI002D80239D|nr:hypothetical protein [Dokdonella sp.]HET9033401.1 hypothetical protein [Dokdonella sp.]
MRRYEVRHLLVLLAFVAMPALAGWKQDYARGLEAAKDGRWDDVQRYMESALADNAKPAKRVRLYGQRFEAYAPQHYAGLAALRLGDCDKALAFWSQAANKVVANSNSELAEAETQGRAECSNRLVRQGKTTPTEAPATARQTPTPAPAPERAPPPPRAVVKAPPPAPPPTVDSRGSSSISTQILRPLVDAYLSGRYNDVIKLSNQVPPTPSLRWQMLTLRAAAAYNLSQLEQSDNAAGIARKAADQARSTDPSRKPDTKYFSPKFIRFFNGR